ncbi:MAG: hypothetical protein HY066_09040 [Betaproteobacteria bacterium]|nr:hypothetical protein [Betaproteobacteria bacterium]
MKKREFKLNMNLPADKIVSINILRLKRYIRTLDPSYKPTAKDRAVMQNNYQRLVREQAARRR